MSTYFIKGKGWRYDFTLKGIRYTEAWFKTKKEALHALARRKEELNRIKTDMDFLGLANRRLDWLQEYKTEVYYRENRNLFKKLSEKWGNMYCDDITPSMIESHILETARRSHESANYELRMIRALFRYGKKFKLISNDPTEGIEFFPTEKKLKYIPPEQDIMKVIFAADPDTRDYLYIVKDTFGRISEINRLTWDDVNFEKRYIVLKTRKKRGSRLTPRLIPMTNRLHDILSRRYRARDTSVPWVFWHEYWSSTRGEKVKGPYQYRGKLMASLCAKAKVKPFGFHALRHAGASLLDASKKVSIGSIQRLLGHENRHTTEVYLHSIGEAEREAMRIYEIHTQIHTQTTKGCTPEVATP